MLKGGVMELYACLEGRQSCRGFTSRRLDRGTVERVLRAANRSPSYMNTQPWEVYAVAGDDKEALAKRLHAHASSGAVPNPDIPFPKEWPRALADRSTDHRLRRFRVVGIDPEDKEAVRQSYLRNFLFFEAPAVLFVGMERSLTPWSVFDLGLFVHGLLLAAHAEGLGAVPQAMCVAYPDIIREELRISAEIYLVLGISIGYPDAEARVNKYRSARRELEEFVHWIGPWT